MMNYLPPVPEANADDARTLSVYRKHGVLLLLDIDYWEGASEQPLGIYYDTCLQHIQNETLLIELDEQRRPLGYITWINDDEDSSVVHVQRQAAPFGDHLPLQKALVRHLPDGARLISHHPRSAREAQAV